MITWAIPESVSFLLLLVSRCERACVCTRFLFHLTNTPSDGADGMSPVCEPRASGPLMTDYAPWHLVTLVKWLGISGSLRGEAIAPTMCLPGVILEAGVHPQHFGLWALSSYPLPPCFASSCSAAMLFPSLSLI